MAEPASIRYRNPGAMWGNSLAIKWGAAKKAVVLNDGKGQGNNIAVFPTHVQGICAQLDLWRTSKHYRNKPFKEAIRVWSGGNSVESYIQFVLKRVPGMTRDTVLNDDFWLSPKGILFLKAQAWHEAGKPYPAPEADWIEARRRVFGKDIPPPPDVEPVPKTGTPKPEKQPWYKRLWTQIAGVAGATGLTIGGVTFDYKLVLALCALIAVGALAAWFCVRFIKPRLNR